MHRARRAPWLDTMVMPAIGALVLVIGYPVIYTLYLSTLRLNLADMAPARAVGLRNYAHLLVDPVFWSALVNTAIYTIGSVAIAAIAGLALALLTENLLGWRFRLVRTLLLMPWAVPAVVVAFLFRFMYLQDGGIINAVLQRAGLIGAPVPWLNDAHLALPSVMVTNIWTMIPFFFLLLTAALAAIPNEVIEAARVDRARTFGMVFHIKLPFLRNALLISSLLMVISNVNDFAKVWAMTEGGPGYATTTLVVYVYRLAFGDFNFGYASAIGVVWLALLLVFAGFYLRAIRTP
jgi:multiple sugar transport system permease protein